MTPSHNASELIEAALSAITLALDHLIDARQPVLNFTPTELSVMEPLEQVAAERIETASHSARPTQAATQFCLQSACEALQASLSLAHLAVDQVDSDIDIERSIRQRAALIRKTRDAGRLAYRASLVLTRQRSLT